MREKIKVDFIKFIDNNDGDQYIVTTKNGEPLFYEYYDDIGWVATANDVILVSCNGKPFSTRYGSLSFNKRYVKLA